MTIEYIKERQHNFNSGSSDTLAEVRQKGLEVFEQKGIPTTRNEEWKYTRIGGLFNDQLSLSEETEAVPDFSAYQLPGHQNANVLVFVNGNYSSKHSRVISGGLKVMPLNQAAVDYPELLSSNLGHSNVYLQDGINAMNTALINRGVFVVAENGKTIEAPLYVYHINDGTKVNMLSQPRSFVYLHRASQLQMIETYVSLGKMESITNQVLEVVVEESAIFDYLKFQNDASHASQVNTTHIRQVGKSLVHTVAISLNGKIVRNNTNILMESPYCEAHLYGLYIQDGNCHVDNHTVVDNKQPNCFSNQLYKGILKDESVGVFNGKIFVRPIAQKTNAFQSNKNILLSDRASVNTKPQLEIFADDVKCSHGCTIGKMDEEGLFYLQSRGIPEETAKGLVLHSFTMDVLSEIKIEEIRNYIDRVISEKLNLV